MANPYESLGKPVAPAPTTETDLNPAPTTATPAREYDGPMRSKALGDFFNPKSVPTNG